ncbi:MAG TPA: hypothetical protein VHJ82_04880 [Actinomycetota bacterium]|nr:hypothetical protein [Actinomycetota bacterium]
MEETAVKEHASAHANAVVAGDLRQAASDLAEGMQETAGQVMRQLPRPVTGAEIEDVTSSDDETTVLIRYSGEDASVLVESRWAERDGRPKIVGLDLA